MATTNRLTIDDLQEVKKALWQARLKWRNLGAEIGVDDTTLGSISMTERDPGDCLRKMLAEWLRGAQRPDQPKSKPRTWRTLVDALREESIDLSDLAYKIEAAKYGTIQAPGSATPTVATPPPLASQFVPHPGPVQQMQGYYYPSGPYFHPQQPGPGVYGQPQGVLVAQQPAYHPYGQNPGGESQQSYHRQAETTRAAIPHEASAPKPPEQNPTGHGAVPSGQCGQYLSASTDNIQTVYEHWNLKEIHALGITGKGITIAIIDDGLNRSHLSVQEKCAGENPEISGSSAQEWHHNQAEHGTAVAAIAAGKPYTTDSGVEIPPGIAPDANLYIYRLRKNFGADDLSDALEHILNEAESKRIDVVAMSVCLKGLYKNIEAQLERLAKKKIVCVAAAGNSGDLKRGAKFPASDSNVLSVGALEDVGQVANITPKDGIDVYAFGKNVVVPSLTQSDAAAYLDGTSFAVPMVAGFLALLFQCTKWEKEFPGCKGVYNAYHDVNFLRQHFIECHKLCTDRRLLYVDSYFLTDLWKCRKLKPSPLIEFHRQIYPPE